MCNCTVRQKKIWLWGTSGCFLTIAIVFGVLWPSLFESVLHKSLKLRQGSLTYDNWIETPLPMYAEFYMFHWENPQDVYKHDIKPRFVEKGPYVFEEKHTRNDVQFFEGNATVAFNQTKTWHFVPEMSNGTLDDEITNLNTIAMTVGYALRHDNALMKIVGKHLLDWAHEHLLITQTVRNLIFDGYDDKILDLLRVLNLKQFTIPFKKFGWFVERNGSSTYDGRFHMGTGENDIRDLGMLSLWNFESRSPAYKDDCGAIKGTTGELWPPEEDHKKPLTMFITDVCRPLTLNYLEEGEKFNVAAQKFVADESVLDNGDKFPEMKCFCTGMENGKCDIAPGALNVSQCKFGAPAFLSFPHFYLADESYREKIEGMDPDEEKHKFHILMHRGMGIPMEVNAGMQINLLMDEYFDDGLFKGLPRIFVPMFWFRQSAAITEDLARSVYWATKATAIGIYVFIAIGAISGAALLCALYLTVTKKWGNQSLGDDDELLTDQ